MKRQDTYLVIGGVIICLVIAIMSPFIASSNPDGLEKSAQDVGVPEMQTAYQAPFPDYTIGDSTIGGIAALFLGVIVTLIIAFVVAMILRRRNPPETTP